MLKNVEVFQIYFGANSHENEFTKFWDQIVQSKYLSWLSEYGSISTGKVSGIYREANPAQGTELLTYLGNLIIQQKIPAPNSNSLYVIHVPQGSNAVLGNNKQPVCQSPKFTTTILGFSNPDGSVKYYPVLIAPDCAAQAAQDIRMLIENASWGLLSAVTDSLPAVGPHGWYDAGHNADIASLCPFGYIESGVLVPLGVEYITTPDGSVYSVKQGYSKTRQKCVVS